MTYSITIPAATFPQARAIQNRIEGDVLIAAALDNEEEGVSVVAPVGGIELRIFVSTPERLLQVTQQLFDQEYI